MGVHPYRKEAEKHRRRIKSKKSRSKARKLGGKDRICVIVLYGDRNPKRRLKQNPITGERGRYAIYRALRDS